MALWDRDLRFVRVNPVLAEINRRTVEEHIGRRMRDVISEMPDSVMEACEKVLETGQSATGLRVSGEQDGVVRTFACDYHPVEAGGEVVGLWATVTEVTDEQSAREVIAHAPAPMVVGARSWSSPT